MTITKPGVTVFTLCPKCGSGKVEMGDLVGDDMQAKCTACGWTGPHRELMGAVADEAKVAAASAEIFGTPDMALGIAQEVSKDFMNAIARDAGRALGLAMVATGVIGKEDPKSLGRLIRAACLGAHKATLEEIEKIQKEIQDGRRESAS